MSNCRNSPSVKIYCANFQGTVTIGTEIGTVTTVLPVFVRARHVRYFYRKNHKIACWQQQLSHL